MNNKVCQISFVSKDRAVFSGARKQFSFLEKAGFVFVLIPADGDFSLYVDYVLTNKDQLSAEKEYVENNLARGDSWGEILLVKKEEKIVGSLGPNRVEKDKQGQLRGRPGYFFVLPEFRAKGIGRALWLWGLVRLREMGAKYVSCSVEERNIAALKVYLACGMRINS